jgi:hypothetical protein
LEGPDTYSTPPSSSRWSVSPWFPAFRRVFNLATPQYNYYFNSSSGRGFHVKVLQVHRAESGG